MARSRRLGIAGEVSVWQIPENGVCTSPCQHGARGGGGVFFFAQDFGRGVFLWEKRSMIDLPIRSCVRPGFVWARRGRGFFATQRLQICGDWILSTQGSPMRGDWILSTQSSPIPIGRWGTRAETTLLLFHPRCKQNFVVVFVSFFLELESIGTRKFKIVS